MEIRVNNQFRIGPSKIGRGSTGDVHRGTDLLTNEEVAIKIEYLNGSHSPHLQLEARVYEALAGETGIPRMLWFGREGDYNVMVLELMGKNLEELFLDREHHFTLPTTLQLAVQMITRVEELHRKGYVHCDIKPSNFVIGLGDKKHNIYLIDFGLAKRYTDPETGQHVPRSRCQYAGTDRYSSLRTHQGFAPTRKDDMESLCYSIQYFFMGHLPWQNLTGANSKHKRVKIAQQKSILTIKEICSKLPYMEKFLKHCRDLKFDEQPDYDYLRNIFLQIYQRNHYPPNFDYDWDRPRLPPITDENKFSWTSTSWRDEPKKRMDIFDGKPFAETELGKVFKYRKQMKFLEQIGLVSEEISNGPMDEDLLIVTPLTPEALNNL